MKKIIFYLFISISLIIGLSSCEKQESTNNAISSEDSIYWFVNGLMNSWYYWYDEVPQVEYLSYDDPEVLLEDLKVAQDKWSFMGRYDEILTYFEEGEEFGFGFHLAWDSWYNLRVIISYSKTEAYAQGIRRGWILEEIDDVNVQQIQSFDNFFSYDPTSMKFRFRDESDQIHTINLSKEVYNQNAVLNTSLFTVNSKKTGYISYQSFLDYSKNELLDAMAYFKSENIEELIVDLRYNTGGSISLAEELAESIVPDSKVGNVFYSYEHNVMIKEQEDESVFLASNTNNLNLSRVFFITNEYSASASELVINGLDPHMLVLQIGDTTSGKPYAMKGFLFQDWVLFPVIAKVVNANGFGDYENGIVPDKLVTDNSAYDWGDINDPAIAQAINYIEYGTFDVISLVMKGTHEPEVLKLPAKQGRNLLLMDK
jgi:carboxyl-terminal processing protease